jgi:riboflavin synthase
MFTGIIEEVVSVVDVKTENTNKHFTFKSNNASELQVDQSIAHNGVCLTVVGLDKENQQYTVTAIKETLDKTNLDTLHPGDLVNFERCLKIGSRLDGHMVQGHVDTTAECIEVMSENGSWIFRFKYDADEVTVPKGSITINGVSLTVVDSLEKEFSVAIIPYTFENTSFKRLNKGDRVNLEFDVIGKYVRRILAQQS